MQGICEVQRKDLYVYCVVVPGTLFEGCFCTYKSDCGNFFRAQVLKFSQPLGLYFPHEQKARVCLFEINFTTFNNYLYRFDALILVHQK